MPKRAVGEIIRRGKIYCIRFYDVRGRRRMESARSERREDAERLLRKRLQAKDDGLPVDPGLGKLKFDAAAADIVNDYKVNRKRSLDDVERRIEKHLTPFFGNRRMNQITTAEVRAFIADRQTAGAANATINRELTTLKRMYTLAVQAGKLLHRPHIPLLHEDNVRTGFFDPEQFASVRDHLPAAIRPVVEFAYITGWRVPSEVLPLEWRQVDFDAEEVRLDPGSTKNGKGRVFPFTDALRTLLKTQHAEHLALKKSGVVEPWVFFRMVAKGRRGPKSPRPITSFTKAWSAACLAAGCPGRIPHDLRRTAVRNLVRAGISERVAMRLTGHLTPSVFARYDIVSGGDLKDAAKKLDLAVPAPARQAG